MNQALAALLLLAVAIGTTQFAALGPTLTSGPKAKFSLAEYRYALGVVQGVIDAACKDFNLPCVTINGSAPAPAPGPGFRPEDYRTYYPQRRMRLVDPGVQTRTDILEMFPEVYFTDGTNVSSSDGGKRRLAAAPPVASTANGGWTLFSVDSGVVVIHLTPLSNGQLFFMERPGNREAAPQIAAVYNIYNNTYRYFPMNDNPFCAGHIQLVTDNVLVVGGDNYNLGNNFVDGRFNVRVFRGGATPSYNITARMERYQPSLGYDPDAGARWYPTLQTMADGNVLFLSGSTTEAVGYTTQGTAFVNPSYAFFQLANASITPARPIQLLQDTDPINLYPFVTVLPNGLVMIISGARTRFYRYTPGFLTNDTTTYPAIPDLPVPALYPQTSTIVLLPLEPPNYVPRILVIGGSSANQAGPTTAATANTYLLDLSAARPTWQVETMSNARVMPDNVLLPDGTLFICNGGDTGIAGGVPGAGAAANLLTGGQSGEIYNISKPFGQRMSGLLASSLRDRLYHSVAWLTPNAEVLVTGSEATEDYSIQIYTPQYLRGNFTRPMLGNPSNSRPAYGALITVPLSFVGGAATNIKRAVLNRVGGVTHSTHFDQRQIALVFTATTTSITLTMPPNANVAQPGQYQLFVVTTAGRPSQGVNIGLGGAVVAARYLEPRVTPILPDGTYTLTNAGRAGCSNYLTAVNCSQGNTIQMGGTGGNAVFNLTYQVHASRPNTYTITNYWRRGFCSSFLGAQACTNGNLVFPYGTDDLSGRQEWTITAAPGGGYYLQVLVGREDCNPQATYLGAAACNSSLTLSMVPATSALTTWALTPVTPPARIDQPPFVPLFPDGAVVTLTNQGRAACTNRLNTDFCATGNGVFMDNTANNFTLQYVPTAFASNSYNLIPSGRAACNNIVSASACPDNVIDIYSVDDGSGRQEFTFSAAPGGGYYIQMPAGRTGCSQLVSAQACGGPAALTFVQAADSSGLQVWTVANASTPPPAVPSPPPPPPPPLTPPTPPGTQYFVNGQYQIQNLGRAACSQYLGAPACSAGNAVSIQTGGTWTFTYLPGAPSPNTYDVQFTSRLSGTGACPNNYLSAPGCGANFVDLYNQDDASGRQQWTFTQFGTGYYINITRGRAGCENLLSANACTQDNGVNFVAAPDQSGRQLWAVAPAPTTPAPPTQVLANGNYYITSVGRANCDSYLGGQVCSTGSNAVATVTAPGTTGTEIWTLTLQPSAAQANTYNILNSGRPACNQYLSAQGCPGQVVDLYAFDDGSGRQQWVVTPVTGGYTLTMPAGRSTCGQVLTIAACGLPGDPFFIGADNGNGQQTFSIRPVNPAAG